MSSLFFVKKWKLTHRSLLLAFVLLFAMGCQTVGKKCPEGEYCLDQTQPESVEPKPNLEEPVVGAEVIKKKVPKVGIVFGPGGLKTLAFSGVVEALNARKIPVKSVVGLGWGALVAGLYSVEGNVTQAQWALSKLDNSELGAQSFLSGKIDRKAMGPFLKEVLPKDLLGKNVSAFEIPFACPTQSVKAGKTFFKNSGSLGDVISKCMPLPPMFKPSGVWVADVFAVEESITYLKKAGVDLVIYLNAMDSGQIFSKSDFKEDPELLLYWQQVHRLGQNLKKKYANPNLNIMVVDVPARRQPLFHGKNLRLLPLAGKRVGEQLAEELQDKYGL